MRCRSRNGGEGGTIRGVTHLPATILHPDDDVRTALDRFGVAEADTLAVAERGTGQVLGTLNEAYAARRYAQETNWR